MINVLLVTDGIFHPPLGGRLALHSLLRKLDGFAFQHTRSLEHLPANLGDFSALVLHYHQKNISPAALAKLTAFVSQGGGLLALHAATASFKQTLPYFEILGGRFVGHGPVERFKVESAQSGIFGDIPAFSIRDELYIHELQPGIEVHFTARHAGQAVPVVWTYQYGQGRVCYAVPGHTTGSMRHPAVQGILRRGLAWVCKQ